MSRQSAGRRSEIARAAADARWGGAPRAPQRMPMRVFDRAALGMLASECGALRAKLAEREAQLAAAEVFQIGEWMVIGTNDRAPSGGPAGWWIEREASDDREYQRFGPIPSRDTALDHARLYARQDDPTLFRD